MERRTTKWVRCPECDFSHSYKESENRPGECVQCGAELPEDPIKKHGD